MANITSTISARGSKGHHTFYLKVEETATSTTNNTSTVKFDFWLVDDNNWYFYGFSNQITYTVKIGDNTYTGNIPDHNNESTTNIRSESNISIAHDNNGTKNLTFSFEVTDTTGRSYTPGDASTSSSVALTAIPRASSATVNSTHTITTTSGNLSFSITSKANYYHKAWYKIDNGSETELTLASSGYVATTTKSFNLANSLILSKMPTITSGTLTIRIQTYSNSGRTTTVGNAVSITSTITIDRSKIKPTLSVGNIAASTTPLAGYAVFGYSTLILSNVTSAIMTDSGATSVTVTARIEGYSGISVATEALTNPSNATITSNTLPSNATNLAANTVKFIITSIDSRGATTVVEKTYNAIIYGYSKPNATLVAYRVNSSTSTERDGAGDHVYVKTMTGSVTNIPSDTNNANTMTLSGVYSGDLSGSITAGEHKELALTSSATLTLTVTDKVGGSTTEIVTIGNAKYPIILRDNKRGTVGVGFGMFPDANMVQSALNMEVLADQAHISFYQSTHNGSMFTGWGASKTRHGVYSTGYATDENTFVDDGKWLLVREADGSVTMNGNATTATRANNATYADWTEEKTTTWQNRYIPFGAGYSTNTSNRGLMSNNGIWYRYREGTTSQLGYSVLALGNTTETGNDGNKQGILRIYARDDSYSDIRTQNTGAGSSIAYLPNISGNIAVETSLWTGTKQGGTSAFTVSNMANYDRIRIYAVVVGDLLMNWEVDVGKLTTTEQCINYGVPNYISNPGGWYMTVCNAYATTTQIRIANFYNVRCDGVSSQTTTQNSSSNYYVYKIVGIKSV